MKKHILLILGRLQTYIDIDESGNYDDHIVEKNGERKQMSVSPVCADNRSVLAFLSVCAQVWVVSSTG